MANSLGVLNGAGCGYRSLRLRFRLVADPLRSMLVLSVVVMGGGPQDTCRGFDLLRTNLNDPVTCVPM